MNWPSFMSPWLELGHTHAPMLITDKVNRILSTGLDQWRMQWEKGSSWGRRVTYTRRGWELRGSQWYPLQLDIVGFILPLGRSWLELVSVAPFRGFIESSVCHIIIIF